MSQKRSRPFYSMKNQSNPFHEIRLRLKTEPIRRFQKNSQVAKEYLKIVRGNSIEPLFIGWVCERDSFFAYIYKRMKKEARDHRKTKIATNVAQSGFYVLLPAINKWVLKNTLPVLIVPVPSRYGVSEKFATELYKMLDIKSKKMSKVKEIFFRLDKNLEIKRINGWTERNRSVKKLFSLRKEERLGQYAVLLVDDIITSGSSLRELASLLKSRGTKSIAAVSLATNLFDSFHVSRHKK